MAYEIPSTCPACGHEMQARVLYCPNCETQVSGDFALGRFSHLAPSSSRSSRCSSSAAATSRTWAFAWACPTPPRAAVLTRCSRSWATPRTTATRAPRTHPAGAPRSQARERHREHRGRGPGRAGRVTSREAVGGPTCAMRGSGLASAGKGPRPVLSASPHRPTNSDGPCTAPTHWHQRILLTHGVRPKRGAYPFVLSRS